MKEIKRVSVASQIVSSIKESIENGQFPVGEKLPSEMKLCELMNVGRSSIREAMRELQAQGYLELKAGKGAFVKRNKPYDTYDTIREWFISSAPNLEDYTEVRMAIEPFAASLACKRATDDEREELKKIHEAFVKWNKVHDAGLLATLDEQFHTQILTMSHNSLISTISDLLMRSLKKYRLLSISVQDNSDTTIEEHNRILSAILDKDTSAAQQAVQFHLNRVQERINALSGSK